jgi:S-DNA-T family DNA segregation ATPase FtsK/SpoIIIE
VEVVVHGADATVGELVAALHPGVGPECVPVIDGAPAAPDVPLSAVALREGSLVDTSGHPVATTRPPARTVAVVGGIRAGVAVDAGRPLVVGRGASADLRIDDPALSPRHLLLHDGVLDDLGSRNGTAVDGHEVVGPVPVSDDAVVRVGTTRLRLAAVVDDRPHSVVCGLGARSGTIPFNRPPRIDPDLATPPLPCPGPAPEAPSVEPLSVAGIALPVVAGAVVAVLFSPFMAVFAALGPVLSVGTWWERRRRARRRHGAALTAFGDAVAEVAHSLPVARAREIRRRRALHPDPGEVVRRAHGPSTRLWERRRHHGDALVVAVGADDEAFAPTLVPLEGDAPAPEVVGVLAAQPRLPDVPVTVDCAPGQVVGIVGDRSAALAIARSLLLQLAVHHGPADLAVVVAADDPLRWSWTAWLPHTADVAAGRRGAAVLHTDDAATAGRLLAVAGERPCVAVLDGDDPFQGRGTAGRRLLAGGAAAIVLVRDEHRLPSACTTLVRVDALGRVRVVDTRRDDRGRPALGWGLEESVAADAARRLARLDDPELPIVGATVPDEVSLTSLLGAEPTAATVTQWWSRSDGTADLAVPIGADGEGPLELDLVADGPHVLVGGTTGSGKSELLRSLVAGVAARADPDHVAMVLVDYKGGAAFDCCRDLPHVVGLVTDLDDTLAARAMRCLEAELRHRERRLRSVGADDLASFRTIAAGRGDTEPLPRLLVVVDEFASLAADLPAFVDALVGIAQRGRSLGVHMVLATQRPAGVVTDDIRANAGCRIALRVTDRHDSVDVVDAPDAADIPRSRPGRAVARFGPGELVPFQSARVTGDSGRVSGVTVRHATGDAVGPTAPVADEGSDLRRLVVAVREAHSARGGRVPRSPWPPPLPADQRRDDTVPSGAWMLVDRPDDQCRTFEGWSPTEGHLVVLGAPGSGATTTLATAALSVVAPVAAAPSGAHLHVIDLDAGALASLDSLAGTGTYAGPTDAERRRRLLRWLDDEVGRRRAGAEGPPLLVVVDDLGGLARSHDPVREPTVHEQLARIWAEGPSVDIVFAVSIRRGADLPPVMAATVGRVLVHRTTDPADALRFGVHAPTSDLPAGRVVRADDGCTAQVVRDADTVAGAVAARAPGPVPLTPPHDVGELASRIPWSEGGARIERRDDGLVLAFARADDDLTPAPLALRAGEHGLVLGPPRAGRTTALATIAAAARATDPTSGLVVVGAALADRVGVDALDPVDIAATVSAGPVLVLVDDATEVDDPTGALARLVTSPPPGVHLVAAARPDRYRAAYGHWSADIRSARLGVLLRPDPLDGDLLGCALPARLALPAVPGRGVLVGPEGFAVVQVVLPPEAQGQVAS